MAGRLNWFHVIGSYRHYFAGITGHSSADTVRVMLWRTSPAARRDLYLLFFLTLLDKTLPKCKKKIKKKIKQDF